MKKSIITIAVVSFVCLLLFFACWRTKKIPEGYVLIKKSDVDSIAKLKNSYPDTVFVKIDSVVYKTEVRKIIEVVYKDSIISDSTRFVVSQYSNEEVNIRVNDYIQGKLLSSDIDYFLLVPKHITKTVYIEKNVPYFVQVQEKQKKFFISGGIGGNWNGLGASGEIGILKGSKNYSFEAVRLNKNYLFLAKAGIRF